MKVYVLTFAYWDTDEVAELYGVRGVFSTEEAVLAQVQEVEKWCTWYCLEEVEIDVPVETE
jgi:hypothetical protein